MKPLRFDIYFGLLGDKHYRDKLIFTQDNYESIEDIADTIREVIIESAEELLQELELSEVDED